MQTITEAVRWAQWAQKHQTAAYADGMPVWIVLDHPPDVPERFTARLHIAQRGTMQPTKTALQSDRLDDLQDVFSAMSLTRIERTDDDDVFVLEWWL